MVTLPFTSSYTWSSPFYISTNTFFNIILMYCSLSAQKLVQAYKTWIHSLDEILATNKIFFNCFFILSQRFH
jgi:hypothetical protein